MYKKTKRLGKKTFDFEKCLDKCTNFGKNYSLLAKWAKFLSQRVTENPQEPDVQDVC